MLYINGMRGWNYTARLGLATGLLGFLCLAQPVRAIKAPDSGSLLQIGQRVRVDYDTTVTKHILLFIPYSEKKKLTIIGDIRSWGPDTILIDAGLIDGESESISISRVTKLYVSVGQKRAVLKGIGIGALLAFFPAASPTIHACDDTGGPPQSEILGRVAVIVAGAVIGGAIGWFTKVDRWKEVEKRDWPFQLDLASQRGDFRLSLTYSF